MTTVAASLAGMAIVAGRATVVSVDGSPPVSTTAVVVTVAPGAAPVIGSVTTQLVAARNDNGVGRVNGPGVFGGATTCPVLLSAQATSTIAGPVCAAVSPVITLVTSRVLTGSSW